MCSFADKSFCDLSAALIDIPFWGAAGRGIHEATRQGWYIIWVVYYLDGFYVKNKSPLEPHCSATWKIQNPSRGNSIAWEFAHFPTPRHPLPELPVIFGNLLGGHLSPGLHDLSQHKTPENQAPWPTERKSRVKKSPNLRPPDGATRQER